MSNANGGQTVGKEMHVNILIRDQIVICFLNVPKETIVNSTINRRLAISELIAIQNYVRLIMCQNEINSG